MQYISYTNIYIHTTLLLKAQGTKHTVNKNTQKYEIIYMGYYKYCSFPYLLSFKLKTRITAYTFIYVHALSKPDLENTIIFCSGKYLT